MDDLTETIESISNNFINGNLSDCKRQIQELGAEAPMTLAYVVLEVDKQFGDSDRFMRWVSRNLEESKTPKNYKFLYYGWIWEAPFTVEEWYETNETLECQTPEDGVHYIYPANWHSNPPVPGSFGMELGKVYQSPPRKAKLIG